MPNELRQKIVSVCRQMNAIGINQGTSGNVSIRNGDGFLITPTSTPYDSMTEDDIVEMDFAGNYAGNLRPSSEWRFHRDILMARPEINAVVHCHSTSATALSCHNSDIPAFHYMVGLAGGKVIRCAEYAAYGTQQLSDNALAALGPRDACLLGHHGQIAIGTTVERALRLAVEVETLAKYYVQAAVLGEPPLLTDEQMDQVLEQMRRMKYGQMPDLDNVTTRPSKR